VNTRSNGAKAAIAAQPRPWNKNPDLPRVNALCNTFADEIDRQAEFGMYPSLEDLAWALLNAHPRIKLTIAPGATSAGRNS
jgi:hypothetical protein